MQQHQEIHLEPNSWGHGGSASNSREEKLWRNSQLLRVMTTWLLYLYHSILNFSQRFSWFFNVFVRWSQTSFQASLQSFSNISVSSIRWPGMHQSWGDPTPLLSGVADWTNTLPKTEHRSILVDIYGLRSVHPPQYTSKKRSVWKPWNLSKRNSKKRLWDSKVDCKNWTSEERLQKKTEIMSEMLKSLGNHHKSYVPLPLRLLDQLQRACGSHAWILDERWRETTQCWGVEVSPTWRRQMIHHERSEIGRIY